MKKLSIVLLAVLLIASLIISCDNSTKALTDELVEVQLGTQAGSRALSSSVTLEQISDSSLTWHYSATKTSQREFKTGETTDKVITLGTTETFSQGKWNFELWATKNVVNDSTGDVTDSGKKVYYGNLTDVLITKSASPVSVIINVSPYVSGVDGYVQFSGVKIRKHAEPDATVIEYVEANRVSVNGNPVTLTNGDSSEISLPAGSHTAIVSYVGDDTVTYAYEEIAFTVYSGRTTTINGFVGEDTATGEITAISTAAKVEISVPVVTTTSGSKVSQETTFTAPVNPANDKTQNTSVKFPQGALPVKADGNASTVNLSVETKNVDSNFSASGVTDNDKKVVSGIDLKVTVNGSNVTKFNDQTVEVNTFIAKGLNGVVVYYNRTPLGNGSYTYESDTGALTIRTTHFSEFLVAATPFEALNTRTNKASTLRDAITEAQNGDTIKLYNNVTSEDGYLIENKKNLVLDLNDKTIKVSKGQSCSFRAVKIVDSNVIIKNGTIDAQNYVDGAATPITSGTDNGAYGTVRIEGNSDVSLENLKLYSNHWWGLSVKVIGKDVKLNMLNCIVETSYGGGIEVSAGYAVIKNTKFRQTNVSYSKYISTGIAVSALGRADVINSPSFEVSGEYAFYVYNSGGIINIHDGSYISSGTHFANIDGASFDTYHAVVGGSEVEARAVFNAFVNENGGKSSIVNIYDGSFEGDIGITSSGNNQEYASLTISGGTFSVNPSDYLAEGYIAQENASGKFEVSQATEWSQIADISWYTGEADSYSITTPAQFAGLNNVLANLGSESITISIDQDIDLGGKNWTPIQPKAHSTIVINGNGKKIKNLTINQETGRTGLFANSGTSNIITINDLSIVDSTIKGEVNDNNEKAGVGAFFGFAEASSNVALNNCSIIHSNIEGGHWTGGFIGYAAGYNNTTDGAVYMQNTLTNCSIQNSTVKGKGSAGGFYGHATGNLWTLVKIYNPEVTNCTVTSTGTSAEKAGSVIGTIGTGRVQVTNYNQTKISGNTVTSNNTSITDRIYGRQGNEPGWLKVDDEVKVQGSMDWNTTGPDGYQPSSEN